MEEPIKSEAGDSWGFCGISSALPLDEPFMMPKKGSAPTGFGPCCSGGC
jgi:hypothetical protein